MKPYTRSIVITHSKYGLTVDVWRWEDANHRQVMNMCKTYRPKAETVTRTIDRFLSCNPPSRVRIEVKTSHVMLVYSFHAYYMDKTERHEAVLNAARKTGVTVASLDQVGVS